MNFKFEIDDSVPVLPKVVISHIFGVSRSAVTQTCRSRSEQEDLVCRIHAFLVREIGHQSTLVHRVQEHALILLQDIRALAPYRNADRKKTAGRPRKSFNFSAIKRVIRAIVAKLCASNSQLMPSAQDSSEQAPVRTRKLRSLATFVGDEAYQKLISGEILDDVPVIPGMRRLRRLLPE